MKKVLLLTDLTVQSLSPIHTIVKDASGEKPVIEVVHMLYLPTSITDLLFIKENTYYNSVSNDFSEAFQVLQNKYSTSVESIALHFIYCSTARYLNNYVEGNAIEAIYMLDSYQYKLPLPQSVQFSTFINNCKTSLQKVSLQNDAFSEYKTLSSLLNNYEQYHLSSNKTAIKTANTF
jgi:hypothetical protein